MRCKIVYEDAEILVIHKPAGLATQSASVGQADAVSELKKYLSKNGKAPYLGIVHRLDQPVEGLLVFAKTPKAASVLSKSLGGESLNKRYYAAVCGKPVAEKGELVDLLMKDGNVARIVTVQEGMAEAKTAKLSYHVLRSATAGDAAGETFGETQISLLEVQIETGRFHQIRAQLSHAGFPILADLKYGNEASKEIASKLGLRTVALAAYSIELLHPVTKKRLSFKYEPEFVGLFG